MIGHFDAALQYPASHLRPEHVGDRSEKSIIAQTAHRALTDLYKWKIHN